MARERRSIAAGVPARQARQFNELYKKHGISAYHDMQTGDLVVESRRARNAVLKLRGLMDRDAGYGDWAGH